MNIPAQPVAGSIKGVLADESGAVVPAAPITLSGNGAKRAAQSQADGSYTFSGLSAGEYTVSVAVPGFTPFNKVVSVAAGKFRSTAD